MKDNPIHSIIYNLRKNYPQLSPGISDDEADLSPLMAVNRGFISVISGSRDPLYEESLLLLEETASQEGEASETAAFYLELLPEIENEMEELFQDKRRVVEDTLNLSEEKGREEELTKGLYSLFFPEGLIDADSPEEDIAALRHKRTCTIINENTSPVKSVPGELLFTSNALLTIPDSS